MYQGGIVNWQLIKIVDIVGNIDVAIKIIIRVGTCTLSMMKWSI